MCWYGHLVYLELPINDYYKSIWNSRFTHMVLWTHLTPEVADFWGVCQNKTPAHRLLLFQSLWNRPHWQKTTSAAFTKRKLDWNNVWIFQYMLAYHTYPFSWRQKSMLLFWARINLTCYSSKNVPFLLPYQMFLGFCHNLHSFAMKLSSRTLHLMHNWRSWGLK